MAVSSSLVEEKKGIKKNVVIQKTILMILFIGAALGVYFLMPDACPESGKRTAMIFVLAAFFWAFDIIPHYATALTVIMLLIFALTLGNPDLQTAQISYKVFLAPFASPLVILFLSGFILAKALNKHHVDSYIAERILFRFGTHPNAVVFGLGLATALLSMWISNIATTAIMLGIMTPLLSQLDDDDPFRMALILAVPFSANVGGIGTPVGCTPNIIALGNLSDIGIHLSFFKWMMMGIPLVILLLSLIFLILIKVFPRKNKAMRFKATKTATLNKKAWAVLAIFSLTITLWLTTHWHHIPEPAVALFGASLLLIFKLLNRNDLNTLDWDILILMWGGLALGTGMQVSGLITWLTSMPLFQHTELVLGLFCLLSFILSNFMSHTAAATLIIPAAISIPNVNPIYTAIAVAMVSSFAMAFPVSTPPNAMAYALGKMSTKDMFKTGGPISLISSLIMLAGCKMIVSFVFDI